MLEKIDSSLILIVQWIVRQIELFTPIVRKEITDVTAKVLLCLIVIPSVMVIVGGLLTLLNGIGLHAWVIMLCFNSIVFFKIWKDLRDLLKIESRYGVLPKEIQTRKIDRKMLLAVILFLTTSLLLLKHVLPMFVVTAIGSVFPDISNHHWLINKSSIFIIYFIELNLIAEYLLCTTSLPPGEKAKKKIERETRNMIPIKN